MTITESPPFLGLVPIGSVLDWPGPPGNVPDTWLLSYGQSVLRGTYYSLWRALAAFKGVVTHTVATPAVFTSATAHGLVIGDPIELEAGPPGTGLAGGTTYYVMTVPSTTTFTVGTTRTINVITGGVTVTGAVAATGAAGGTLYFFHCPYEVADASHFYLPDYRGNVTVTKDDMGGSDSGRIPWANVLGIRAGEGTHTLLATESGIPTHSHVIAAAALTGDYTLTGAAGGAVGLPAGQGTGVGTYPLNRAGATDNAGPTSAAAAHNLMQPGIVSQKIIYAGV